jgi:hypothetical protein
MNVRLAYVDFHPPPGTLHRAISRFITMWLSRDGLLDCRRWSDFLKVPSGRVLGHSIREFCQGHHGYLDIAPIRK